MSLLVNGRYFIFPKKLMSMTLEEEEKISQFAVTTKTDGDSKRNEDFESFLRPLQSIFLLR
jgi:hypothetical protein